MKPEDLYKMLEDPNLFFEKHVEWGIVKSLEEKTCEHCDSNVVLRIRKKTNFYSFLYRCKSMECRKEVSIFKNTFYSFVSENKYYKGLSTDKLLKLIFYYFKGKTYDSLIDLTDIKQKNSIVDWTNYIREEVNNFLNKEKMGGLGCIVQADESLIRGRRKYNRGRLLIGDVIDNKLTIT